MDVLARPDGVERGEVAGGEPPQPQAARLDREREIHARPEK